MFVQACFFGVCGAAFSLQGALFRFWGWRENAAEVARFSGVYNVPASKKAWGDYDFATNKTK